ncbi:serine/threonine-protein kinase SMG1 [Entomortierella parvispora]|uniref:non-specific serine/threonine protein kinase n=1 Tax=Entomortierella parvispora TaxID=205924 RepID=A0A9P3LWG0_9FUNG|nr:serine/threonine-protein kinase SMG1 [Entomortierella parvispora]
MKSTHRRPQPKNAALVPSYAPTFVPMPKQEPEGLRPNHGVKVKYDLQTATMMLEEIEDALDRTADSTGLVQTLDQLLVLSGQQPIAWEPKFRGIIDLLVGWHVDLGTNAAVRKRISDVLSSFSMQWTSAADFGQDLLEFFINDIDCIIADSATATGAPSSMETAVLLMSCFNIIAKALIGHAYMSLDRLAAIQERTVGVIARMDTSYKPCIAAGNDIILTLSQGDASSFYTLQPKSLHFIIKQLNPQADRATWRGMVKYTKKILGYWRPHIHHEVMHELLHAKSRLMQSRWRVSGNADRAQDVLDIILLALPATPPDEPDIPPIDKSGPLGAAWISIMDELEQILQRLSASNFLSNREDFRSALQNSKLLHTDVPLSKYEKQDVIEHSTDRDLVVNLTIDTMLLVEISKHTEITFTMLVRLLEQLLVVPEERLTVVLYALKEISEGQDHYAPGLFESNLSEHSDSISTTALGKIHGFVQALVSQWRLLPSAMKICIIAWDASIKTTIRIFRPVDNVARMWKALKNWHSSFLPRLIIIAGIEEDELIRRHMAIMFEQFILTYGSMSIGPDLLVSMIDRSTDVSSQVGDAWSKVVFQSNPFEFAFDCYNRHDKDVLQTLKLLVLKTPNSGIFRYPHFSIVLSSMTLSGDESVRGSTVNYRNGDMLQRLFHACQGRETLARVNADSSSDTVSNDQLAVFQHSQNLLRYWALWETARYCVLSRLRTPFGGPQQTLDALEKHLNSLLRSDQKKMDSDARLNPLRDFLNFLDRLELQFYNAAQGTALGVIPLAPKPTIVFARSNKRMWDEWFARVRRRTIEGAKATDEHELVIRHGYMLLSELFDSLSRGAVSDIIPWIDDFELLLVDLVEALIATNSADAITGLQVWCRRAIKDLTKQTGGRSRHSRSDKSSQHLRFKNACLNEVQAAALSQISLDWIATAVSRAQHRYEQFAKDAVPLVGSYSEGQSADDITPPEEFLSRQISAGLGDLCSYKDLQSFLDSIPIDVLSDQTYPWSGDAMNQSLRRYCAEDSTEAWKHLEDYYSVESKELHELELTPLEQSAVHGRNFLFASKIYQQHSASTLDLGHLRQEAAAFARKSAEFSFGSGLGHANTKYMDIMMLNTAESTMPMAMKELMDQLAQIPDELKMNLLNKDLRNWVRLDTMVNLAKKQVGKDDTCFVKQANEFKFLLSKIARRTDCHSFASDIPRTWEGALSPEIQFEEAKAAMAKHDYTTALESSRRILDRMQQGTDMPIQACTPAVLLESKIYLKLAKWSRSSKPSFSADHLETFENIIGLEHDMAEQLPARIERITSSCLQKAIEIGSDYRKSWFAFGTHHYKQGWGILDELGSFRFHHPVATAANETLKGILVAAGIDHPADHSKNIFSVFVRHCASGQPFDETSAYESIRAHLLKIEGLSAAENVISEIIGSFQTLLLRILETYRLAIRGYFKFLQFASLEFDCRQPGSKNVLEEDDSTQQSQSAITDEITATLRLLRLLAKHGAQLYDVFKENLVDINVRPWANIIPQLFARLDHPEQPVQSLIADLLCKIGDQSPQLIVFHCVVGSNSAHNSLVQRKLLRHIGEALTRTHPELVTQVQHLVRELERVTVLWEEIWFKKIMSGVPELKAALQDLTEQYQGLEVISGLGPEEKHTVMYDNYQQTVIPLLATFESLQDSNARPESNHERWFISAFRDRIQDALESMRSPKSWSNMYEGLAKLKEIHSDLGKEVMGSRVLQLADLSPELASLQSSLIEVPNQSTGVTIQSFDQQVVVIPTKTKPKKLSLMGSDGKRYTYLFKGLEDLHLDERVMQLLRISNGMLVRDKESNSRQLSARHYAVVPLSDNSGMIQWVENTVSIFTIIAKWQHRELMCNRWMNDDTGTSAGPQVLQRATEVYNEKAAAALKKAGLPTNHPRKLWSKSMLVDLYQEMASETPADLLERELWASSPTLSEWWRKSVRFSRSTAVMSMIGYVIGLGDRHLDNILIDFTTGDMVHIDYNVCFEKGRRLRIPEIVPFRLTRNMLTSLGATGVEGNFRIACEQTMKVMRKNKEILVTLLEAFVYDPLVDWQVDVNAAQGGAGAPGAPTGVHGVTAADMGSLVSTGPGANSSTTDLASLLSRDGLQSLAVDSESESGSVVSSSTYASRNRQRDSKASLDSNSARSMGLWRRPSTDSLVSVSSRSIQSISTNATTVESSSKSITAGGGRWNTGAGDPLVDSSTGHSNGGDGGTSTMSLQAHPPPHQQQPQQQQQPPLHQRNAYAVNILRRVRHKLEGRDFDPAKKCKVAEQVDRVIQEATQVENLANMYEGWTPWL